VRRKPPLAAALAEYGRLVRTNLLLSYQGIRRTSDLASLGTAASRGCIRMSVPDVKQLYRQVKPARRSSCSSR